MNFLLDNHIVDRVTGGCDIDNEAMMNVFRKCGMSRLNDNSNENENMIARFEKKRKLR